MAQIDSDDLTSARAGRAKCAAHLAAATDAEDIDYLRTCLIQWDQHIKILEARAERTRQPAEQPAQTPV